MDLGIIAVGLAAKLSWAQSYNQVPSVSEQVSVDFLRCAEGNGLGCLRAAGASVAFGAFELEKTLLRDACDGGRHVRGLCSGPSYDFKKPDRGWLGQTVRGRIVSRDGWPVHTFVTLGNGAEVPTGPNGDFVFRGVPRGGAQLLVGGAMNKTSAWPRIVRLRVPTGGLDLGTVTMSGEAYTGPILSRRYEDVPFHVRAAIERCADEQVHWCDRLEELLPPNAPGGFRYHARHYACNYLLKPGCEARTRNIREGLPHWGSVSVSAFAPQGEFRSVSNNGLRWDAGGIHVWGHVRRGQPSKYGNAFAASWDPNTRRARWLDLPNAHPRMVDVSYRGVVHTQIDPAVAYLLVTGPKPAVLELTDHRPASVMWIDDGRVVAKLRPRSSSQVTGLVVWSPETGVADFLELEQARAVVPAVDSQPAVRYRRFRTVRYGGAIADGNYALHLFAEGDPPDSPAWTPWLAPQLPAAPTLEPAAAAPALRTVTLRFHERSGWPLARVLVHPLGRPHELWVTDLAGRVRRELPAGTYEVKLGNDPYEYLSFEVPPGRGPIEIRPPVRESYYRGWPRRSSNGSAIHWNPYDRPSEPPRPPGAVCSYELSHGVNDLQIEDTQIVVRLHRARRWVDVMVEDGKPVLSMRARVGTGTLRGRPSWAVMPRSSWSGKSADPVQDICSHLEGMPRAGPQDTSMAVPFPPSYGDRRPASGPKLECEGFLTELVIRHQDGEFSVGAVSPHVPRQAGPFRDNGRVPVEMPSFEVVRGGELFAVVWDLQCSP